MQTDIINKSRVSNGVATEGVSPKNDPLLPSVRDFCLRRGVESARDHISRSERNISGTFCGGLGKPHGFILTWLTSTKKHCTVKNDPCAKRERFLSEVRHEGTSATPRGVPSDRITQHSRKKIHAPGWGGKIGLLTGGFVAGSANILFSVKKQ